MVEDGDARMGSPFLDEVSCARKGLTLTMTLTLETEMGEGCFESGGFFRGKGCIAGPAAVSFKSECLLYFDSSVSAYVLIALKLAHLKLHCG